MERALKTILVRVDGGSARDVGTGHVSRCLRLAGALREAYAVVFASLDRPEFGYGHARITSRGYPLRLLAAERYPEALRTLVGGLHPDFVICDLYAYDEEELKVLKGTRAPLMTFDHFDAHRRYSDYPINAVSPRPRGPFDGPDYVVVPPPRIRPFRETPEAIFVCFGGFDHLDLTARVTRVLAGLDVAQRVHVVVSDIYPHVDALKAVAGHAAARIAVQQQPPDFDELLADSDIAVVSGGLTLFQALSLGVPVVVISQYEHQVRTVSDFARHQAYVDLGKGEVLDERKIGEVLTHLIDDPAARRQLRRNAQALVDGRGLERVVRIVKGALG